MLCSSSIIEELIKNKSCHSYLSTETFITTHTRLFERKRIVPLTAKLLAANAAPLLFFRSHLCYIFIVYFCSNSKNIANVLLHFELPKKVNIN